VVPGRSLAAAGGQLSRHTFLHRSRDTVVRDQVGTMLYEEPLKDEHSRSDVGHDQNATVA
jgi:hypothetical protein